MLVRPADSGPPRHSDVDEMGGAILEKGGILLQEGKKGNRWAKERR